MVIEPFLAGAVAGATAWVATRFGRRRARARRQAALNRFLAYFDADARAALEVARVEWGKRGVATFLPVHVLWGLLQIERFAVAIEALGGSPAAIENAVLEELDHPTLAPEEVSRVLNHAAGAALALKREATIVGLWIGLARTNAATLVDVPPLSSHALSFWLVHGCREPAVTTADGEATVVLRNDDYTTMEFVVALLRDVFALPEPRAQEIMRYVHERGRADVGRYPGAEAVAKVGQARALARREGHPLRIAIESM